MEGQQVTLVTLNPERDLAVAFSVPSIIRAAPFALTQERDMTALRAIYKPSIYTFAALLTAGVMWSSYKVFDPQFMVLYGLAFGTGFVVGRQTKV
jgi:hypothetical protein